jgi:hypothetical protein
MLFLMMFLNISKENLSNKKSAAQELQSPAPPLKKKPLPAAFPWSTALTPLAT